MHHMNKCKYTHILYLGYFVWYLCLEINDNLGSLVCSLVIAWTLLIFKIVRKGNY